MQQTAFTRATLPNVVLYQGESIDPRMALASAAGVWLDYWLFLHADDAHAVWCARPFGVQRVAAAVLDSTGKTDRALRRQLAREAVSIARLAPFCPSIPPEPQGEPLQSQDWARDWLGWCEQLQRFASPLIIAHELSRSLAKTLVANNWWTATFLTRRFAAELAEDDWSRRVLFQRARNIFLTRADDLNSESINEEALVDALNSVFTSNIATRYEVTIGVMPFQLGKEVARKVQNAQKVLFVGSEATAGVDVTAMRIYLDAAHVEEAVARALDRVRETLERLRTFHYVRVHLSELVTARTSADVEPSAVRMPQLFWIRSESSVREVPVLPRGFDNVVAFLPDTNRRRWTAARWHLSQALADWPEDAHSAASHAWQALEAFVGAGGPRQVLSLIPEYLEQVPGELATYLGRTVSLQRYAFLQTGRVCNWLSWASSKGSIDTWLSKVLSPPHRYRSWRPTPPEILFDHRVGLLRVVQKAIQAQSSRWMNDRLAGDFVLLYSLRNRVVHTGQRMLGRPGATYLARNAIEVLLALIARRTAYLKSQTGAPHAG